MTTDLEVTVPGRIVQRSLLVHPLHVHLGSPLQQQPRNHLNRVRISKRKLNQIRGRLSCIIIHFSSVPTRSSQMLIILVVFTLLGHLQGRFFGPGGDSDLIAMVARLVERTPACVVLRVRVGSLPEVAIIIVVVKIRNKLYGDIHGGR